MSLQHELSVASSWVPELDTAVLGTTQHPIAVRSKRDAEYEVLEYMSASSHVQQEHIPYLVAFESADALAARRMSWDKAV